MFCVYVLCHLTVCWMVKATIVSGTGVCRPIAGCIYRAVCRMGSYLLVLYLVSKLCYIANVVCQLFVLNKVLGMTYSTFGIDMIKYVIYSHKWA